MKRNKLQPETVPLKFEIRVLYVSSIVIACMVAAVSIIGIVFQTSIYPDESIRMSFVPNDIVNLIAGLPLLIISMLLAWRKKLIGLLSWPGAIFYMAYVYFPYLMGVPFNILFLPYLVIFALSIYSLIGIIVSIDGAAVTGRISGTVPARTSGGILIGLSVLILIRQSGMIVASVVKESAVPPADIALWIDDFAIAGPAMFLGGILLWKKKQLGYVVGGGLLLVYGVLSIGLIPFLAIQSYMKKTSMDLSAIVILIAMGLVCLIPFSFFVRSTRYRNNG